MNPSITIRETTEADIAAIFELICLKAEFDGCRESLLSTPEQIKEALFGAMRKCHALIAELDGQPVGLATFYSMFSTFLAKPGIWLDDLYVKESYRSLGVGKALMQRLALLAHDNGCARIDWLVATENADGQAFYDHLGARMSHEVRHCRLGAAAIAQLAKEEEETDNHGIAQKR